MLIFPLFHGKMGLYAKAHARFIGFKERIYALFLASLGCPGCFILKITLGLSVQLILN